MGKGGQLFFFPLVIFNREVGNAESPLPYVCDCKQNTCSCAMNFTRKTQGIFTLIDAEAPHSAHINCEIGCPQIGIATLSIGI